jgi:hypothetical protein
MPESFFALRARHVLNFTQGRVAEWLMAPVLKTGVPERVSGVRIPPLPPFYLSGLRVAIRYGRD